MHGLTLIWFFLFYYSWLVFYYFLFNALSMWLLIERHRWRIRFNYFIECMQWSPKLYNFAVTTLIFAFGYFALLTMFWFFSLVRLLLALILVTARNFLSIDIRDLFVASKGCFDLIGSVSLVYFGSLNYFVYKHDILCTRFFRLSLSHSN